MMNPHSIFSLSAYYLNPYFIPPAIVASLVLFLGFFILSLEQKSNFNRSFLYLCISSAVWLYGNSLVFNSRFPDTAFFWSRILFMGLTFVPVTIFHISVNYTEKREEQKGLIETAYVLGAVWAFLIWNRNFLSGVREYTWGFYPDSGVLQNIFLIYLFLLPAIGILNLINHYRQAKDALGQKRTGSLIVAFVFILLSYSDVLIGYAIHIYPFGYLAILCFVLSIMYSIIKHHNLMVEHYTKELEKEVREKTREVSRFVAELRMVQLKLMESSKVSALASLSAGILHQISQPITAIHGFAKFLKKEMKETDPYYKAINIMEEQSVYLKDMLEDLMELIRHREIKKENIDVNQSIKRATNLLTDELRIRRINWDTVLEENLPRIYADGVHLQQVFMNIVVNAMDALSSLPKGSTRYIKITSKSDKDSNKVLIMFEDTGPGITPETQQQIFEPFFSTKAKGAGIGLSLCKDLIAEHGGEIAIESKGGKGVSFSVKFPAVQPAPAPNS